MWNTKMERGQQNWRLNGEMEEEQSQFATHFKREEGTGLHIWTALFHSNLHNFPTTD